MSAAWPIDVSPHACQRLRERQPGVLPHHWNAARFVKREVREAIAAGRVAKRRPAWLSWHGRARSASFDGEHVRIAWTEDEQRAYVLQRVRRSAAGYSWVVKTILVAVGEAT